jgi:hypothetical protein
MNKWICLFVVWGAFANIVGFLAPPTEHFDDAGSAFAAALATLFGPTYVNGHYTEAVAIVAFAAGVMVVMIPLLWSLLWRLVVKALAPISRDSAPR